MVQRKKRGRSRGARALGSTMIWGLSRSGCECLACALLPLHVAARLRRCLRLLYVSGVMFLLLRIHTTSSGIFEVLSTESTYSSYPENTHDPLTIGQSEVAQIRTFSTNPSPSRWTRRQRCTETCTSAHGIGHAPTRTWTHIQTLSGQIYCVTRAFAL